MPKQDKEMNRGLTGHYSPVIAGGIACKAFVPAPFPPLEIDGKLQSRINQAMLAQQIKL